MKTYKRRLAQWTVFQTAATFLGALALATSCSNEPVKFSTATSANGADAANQDKGEGDLSTGRTRIIDTFLLPGTDDGSDEFMIPTEPFQIGEFEQPSPTQKSSTTTVLDENAPNKSITVYGATSTSTQLDIRWTGKPVDIFVVIDDSESFSGQKSPQDTLILRSRAKNAIQKLISNLSGTDWKIFMSGLPGGSNDFSILTPATVGELDAKLNNIFLVSAVGDERVFQGLTNLAGAGSGQDRDNAVHGYLVISDAPNCKDMSNNDSASCNRTPGNGDFHKFVFDNNPILPGHMKNMTLFGAYYRQTNGSACSNLDSIEVPSAGETLKLNSQYADLAFTWEKFLYPSTPDGNNPRWVGDICASSEDLSFVDRYTDAIKNLATYRFVLNNSFEDFGLETALNFAVKKEGGQLASNEFITKDNRLVIITNEGGYNNQSLTGVGNQKGNYRNTDFGNALGEPARDRTVFVSWDSKTLACRAGNDFSGAAMASAPCRHSGGSLVFRDSNLLPLLPAANPGQTKALTIKYKRDVAVVTSIKVTAPADLIQTDQIQLVATPAVPGTAIPASSKSINGRDIIFTFASALPPGTYEVKYFDASGKKFSVTLPALADRNKSLPVCYMPPQKASLSGNTIVLDSGSAIPCSLNANNKLVELDTMIPVNAATGKRNLRIAYLASQAPQSDFDLSAPPSDGTLTIRRFNENDAAGTVLSAADFTLKNSRIHLASPLVAGQKIVVSYEFLPDLGSGCFVLTGKVAKSSTYRVRYGAPDHAEPLDASKYTVTENSAKDEKICLKKEILDYGMQIEVDYVAVVFN